MFTAISSSDISLNVREAKRITEHMNKLLDGTGFSSMLMDPGRPLTVHLNKEVMSGRVLGTTYAKQFSTFMENGGLLSMIHCFDANKARFRYGMLGSMWMDMVLTGNVQGTRVQKIVALPCFR